MRTVKVLWLLAALSLGPPGATPALAGSYSVTATLNGSSMSQILNPSAAVTINLGDGSAPNMSYLPGEVNWTVNSSNLPGLANGAAFKTFCLELTQDISPGSATTYTLTQDLASLPKPGSSQTGGSAGMGTAKATTIENLWGTFYNSIGNNGTNAAAFQLAIWKIEYDWGSSSATNFSAGNFLAKGNSAATNQATAWLTYLQNGKGPVTTANNLWGMTSPGAQDQITAVAPAPSALVLAGIGLFSLCGAAWARNRPAGKKGRQGATPPPLAPA
jgi:hypothetical protein